MRDIPLGVRRYKRDWLRGRDMKRGAAPSPEPLLFSMGALVLAALLLNVAVTWLARGFGH